MTVPLRVVRGLKMVPNEEETKSKGEKILKIFLATMQHECDVQRIDRLNLHGCFPFFLTYLIGCGTSVSDLGFDKEREKDNFDCLDEALYGLSKQGLVELDEHDCLTLHLHRPIYSQKLRILREYECAREAAHFAAKAFFSRARWSDVSF